MLFISWNDPAAIIIGVLVVAAIFALIIFKRKKTEQKERAEYEAELKLNPYYRADQLLKSGVFRRTSKGVRVFPEAQVSAQALDAENFAAIDGGLDDVFARFLCEYPDVKRDHNALKHEEYEVCIFESVKTPAGNWAFKVPVDGYKGTEYDQGGFIYAGAMVTGVVGETYTMSIPDTRGVYSATRRGVDYEGEHWLLAAFDGARFEATKIHGVGSGHPLLGGCADNFVAARPQSAISPDYESGRQFCCVLPVK